MRRADRAVLATAHGPDGWPFGSLVLLALDHDATPLLLISTLAEHTKAICNDCRVSLLVDGTVGLAEPLTGPRVTVLGRALRSDLPRHRARYLARHPAAALYAGFTDFAIYRVVVERAHFVAGFGQIRWIEPASLLFEATGCEALINGQAALVERLNTEYRGEVQARANSLPRQAGIDWRVTGVDPEGIDLRHEGETARVDFAEPARTPDAAITALLRDQEPSP